MGRLRTKHTSAFAILASTLGSTLLCQLMHRSNGSQYREEHIYLFHIMMLSSRPNDQAQMHYGTHMELDSGTNPHEQPFERVPLPLLARVDVHDSRHAVPVKTACFCFILTSELVPAGQLIRKRHST